MIKVYKQNVEKTAGEELALIFSYDDDDDDFE